MISFVYVPLLPGMKKRCGLNIGQVLEKFGSDGKFDYRFKVEIDEGYGDTFTVALRWHMCRRKSSKPVNRSMALPLHDVRFDCIDHELVVADRRGHTYSGWHQHHWDDAIERCDFLKECIDGFGESDSFKEFVRDASDLKGIVLEEGGREYGESDLLFP